MNLIFGRLSIVRHREDTIGAGLADTSSSVSTAETPWHLMYKKDKYARNRVMKSARLLLPYLKQGDTVLDVGCFTQEARKYFTRDVKYIGIDEKAYHAETKVVNLHHGFEPIPCSHALCLETLEHLVDPQDCLQSLHQSIGHQGFLVVSLPNEITLFHRLRCLLGIADGQCFSGEGKHLHLPSLSQSRKFLRSLFQIEKELFYISPTAVGSQQEWIGRILSLIPDAIHQWLADLFPSLFSRGFIFLLKKKSIPDSNSHQ